MRAVLFMLKFVEMLLSFDCILIHILGFSNHKEPFPHVMIFCGTFFGYFMISLMACLALCFGSSMPLIIDVIVSSLAAILFIACSMLAMVEAEHDYHLMYLTDSEEKEHPFFYMNRAQSIASLITGLWFLMHTILVFDMLYITEPNVLNSEPAVQPLQLSFCWPAMNEYCSQITEENNCLRRFSLRKRIDRPMDRVV